MTENIEVFPLTITIPQSFKSTSIIEIVDSYASMRAVFVERDSIYDIPDMWRNACGFYILFSRIKQDGHYSVYVGKSDRDFTQRLRSHDLTKEGWTTALLVQRNSIENLSSTQSSYLEGALRDIFDEASHVKCYNIAPTGDRTLPVHERLLMKQVIESTLRIMLIRGYRKSLPVQAGTLTPSAITPAPVFPVVPPAPPILSVSPPRIGMSVPSKALEITEPPLAPPSPVLLPEPALLAPVTPSVPVPVARAVAPEKKNSVLSMFRRHEAAFAPAENAADQPAAQEKPHDPEEVFQALRAWRVQKAREERSSPAYIFDDKVLRALAEQMPLNYEELLSIPGMEQMKRRKYGVSILEILDRYRLRALT